MQCLPRIAKYSQPPSTVYECKLNFKYKIMGKKSLYPYPGCRKIIHSVMKTVFIFLLLLTLQVNASVYSQEVKLNLNLKNGTFKEIIDEICRLSEFSFVYSDWDLPQTRVKNLKFRDASIEEVLRTLLAGTGLSYEMTEKTILLKKAPVPRTSAQQIKVVQGKVIDTKGNPLPGVTVVVKGTTLGSSTNADGEFRLELPDKQDIILSFSFIGMKPREIKYTGQKEITVKMEEETVEMDAVVVTGMFNRRKEGFTGSAVRLKGDDLKKISTTNISKALAAVDPSFRIMEDISSGSNPNRLPDLRMRGQATLPGGATTETSADVVALQGEYDTYPNKPLIIQDGFEIDLQAMVDLDPDRVEAITLLKDAAATAIYGARAANGVIVIETKTPKVGRLWVTYSGNVRLETPDLSAYNLMNAKEKLEAERLAGFYKSNNGALEPLELYASKLREVLRGVDTYWLDKPLRTAAQHRHSLSFEGGDHALRYKLYFGGNFTPGVMKGSKRNTMTGALDLLYRFKKVLLKNSVSVEDAVGEESPWGDFSEYTRLNPYLRPYGKNGEILKRLDAFDMSFRGNMTTLSYANPMYNAQLNTINRTGSFRVRNQFSIEYNPNSDLRLTGAFSLSKLNGKTEVFRPAQHTAFDYIKDPTKKGDFRRTENENFDYALDLTASYNKLFAAIHYVTANARFSLQETKEHNYGAYVTGFPNENMDDILFGKKYDEKMTGAENTSRLVAASGSFGYSYDFKYSVDFNISINGSSQFGKDNRFAPFWSAGLRWDVKKEQFMTNIDFISGLILRSSYGVTGTQGFAPYQSRELYSYGNLLKPYESSDATGAELVAMPNEKLKWQETDTWNIALELGLLKGRITARAEYYQKLTTNSLTQITIAPSLGFRTRPENLGTLENKGVELNLAFIPYQNISRQAYWIITLNGSHNTDKLKKISEAMRRMNEINAGMLDNDKLPKKEKPNAPLPHYVEGESINRLWAVRSLGIDPSTGTEIFLKRNGRMTGKYDVADLMPVGTTEPKLQGNINSSFSYKGFGIDMNFSYKFGGQAYNSTLMDKVENADLVYNADKRVLALRWKNPGDISRYQAISNTANGSSSKISSRFVMDENTFQMGSLALSYRMDKTNADYVERWGLSSVKVGFNMEDLFYISSIKRERGISYPFARQFSLSLNVAF